jgi:phosphohistidine phosphatase
MKCLYLLRHGQADWPDWDRPDDERPLTPKGKKQVLRVARAVASRAVRLDLVLSSPLPRARQTAEIAADALGVALVVEPALAPGFSPAALRQLLITYAGRDAMLVGHEPDFSAIIENLTGAVVVMPKAGLARVDLSGIDPPSGELRWLIPPKFLR